MATVLKENEDFSIKFIGPKVMRLHILSESYGPITDVVLGLKDTALVGKLSRHTKCGGNRYCEFEPTNLKEYEEFFLKNQCSEQILYSIIEEANDYWTVVEGGRVQVSDKLGCLLRRYVDKLKQEIIKECRDQK